MDSEVVFDEFNKTMIILPRGVDIPRELEAELTPYYFSHVSKDEFEYLNDRLTTYCR
jgi:hypothetical protein